MGDKIRPGDIVRLKNGRAPIVVQKVRPHPYKDQVLLCGRYYRTTAFERQYAEHHDYIDVNYRNVDHFTHYEGDPEKYYSGKPLEEIVTEDCHIKENDMPKLYQTKEETPRFGTFLTENSEGHYVLELKGASGAVEAFAPDMLTEVVPYTVEMKIIARSEGTQHYKVKKGVLAKGDWVIRPDGVRMRVNKTNTKARDAGALPDGTHRLMTEPLDTADEDVTDN